MIADMTIRHAVELNAPLVTQMTSTLFMQGDNLAIDVGNIHRILVDDINSSHTCSCQSFADISTHAAHAENKHLCRSELI